MTANHPEDLVASNFPIPCPSDIPSWWRFRPMNRIRLATIRANLRSPH